MPFKFLIAALATAAGCLAQTASLPDLGLSVTQRSAIVSLNRNYNSDVNPQQQTLFQLSDEIRNLMLQTSPDPLQLGSRALQIEMISRNIEAQQAVLRQKVSAVLNADQTATVRSLTALAELRPIAADAACALFESTSVGSGVTQWFTGSLFYTPYATALITSAPSPSFCGSSLFPASVRVYLNLTDTQIAAACAASTEYADFYQQQLNRTSDVNAAIADLTNDPAADPVVLGALYLELSQINQRIRDKQAQIVALLRAQLTPAQMMLLQNLDLSISPVINQLAGCNILLPSAASGIDALSRSNVYDFCSL